MTHYHKRGRSVRWSDKEIALLQEFYPTIWVKNLVHKFPNRTKETIVAKARHLNLPSAKLWQPEENAILQTHFANSQKEITSCSCGKNFSYSKIFYSHVGHYYCECGKERIKPDILAKNVKIYPDYSEISLSTKDGDYTIKLKMPGLYNVYNALCAISIATSIGIKSEIIVNGLESYSTVFGRAETIKINDKDMLIQLIKNPVGATEVLKTVVNDPNSRMIIAINDNYADGRDVSWLWDAEFELLQNHKKQLICSGDRANDMAVRLKYAGIKDSSIKVEENIRKAIETMTQNIENNEKLYILPTYTVLLEMQTFLPKIVDK